MNTAIWLSPDTFATTLVLLFVDRFGIDAFAGEEPWDAETIQLEISDILGTEFPDAQLSKLLAMQLYFTTDRFFVRLADFIRICNVLSGATSPDPDDPADVDEIAWAMTECLLLEPPDEPEPFSREIRRYIGEVLREEGFLQPPDLLQIGIRTDDWQQDLATEYGHDQQQLQLVLEAAAQKNAEVKHMIKARLQALLVQLQSLRLDNGDTADLMQKLRNAADK